MKTLGMLKLFLLAAESSIPDRLAYLYYKNFFYCTAVMMTQSSLVQIPLFTHSKFPVSLNRVISLEMRSYSSVDCA